MNTRPAATWLSRNWVVGAAFMSAALFILAPPVVRTLSSPVALLYLHSPAYMLHQVEEHAGDRFRTFVNAVVFGRIAMTASDVLIVNVGLVWPLNAAALYVGVFAGPEYALVAPYAMLVNAIGHAVMAAKFHRYNPGTVTATLIFLPLSLATLASVAAAGSATLAHHALGLVGAIVLHAVIAVNAVRRARARWEQESSPGCRSGSARLDRC